MCGRSPRHYLALGLASLYKVLQPSPALPRGRPHNDHGPRLCRPTAPKGGCEVAQPIAGLGSYTSLAGRPLSRCCSDLSLGSGLEPNMEVGSHGFVTCICTLFPRHKLHPPLGLQVQTPKREEGKRTEINSTHGAPELPRVMGFSD